MISQIVNLWGLFNTMKTKILIIGSKGAVGQQLVRTLIKNDNKNFKSISRKDFDFKNFDKIKKLVKNYKPTHIVNCVALTGLEQCEKNFNEALEINTYLPFKLSKLIKGKKIKLIHFSTDAVFLGKIKKKIYNENDLPSPSTIYGKTKFLAEELIKFNKNVLIIRLPTLFGPSNKNQIIDKLINNLLNNKKIFASIDIFSTPVFTPYLCNFIYDEVILKKKFLNRRIIHFTSNQYMSIYDLIKKISAKLKIDNKINRVKDSYFKSKIVKPKNLGLKSLYKHNMHPNNFSINELLINRSK